jgi:hypothetical protein
MYKVCVLLVPIIQFYPEMSVTTGENATRGGDFKYQQKFEE